MISQTITDDISHVGTQERSVVLNVPILYKHFAEKLHKDQMLFYVQFIWLNFIFWSNALYIILNNLHNIQSNFVIPNLYSKLFSTNQNIIDFLTKTSKLKINILRDNSK